MKLIVVRTQQGEILSYGLLKIKKDKLGQPILFLEKGLTRVGYDFKQEMLSFLSAKSLKMSQALGQEIPVYYHSSGGKKDSSQRVVYGVGTYTGNEYVEPLWGWRPALHFYHQGSEWKSTQHHPPLDIMSYKSIGDHELAQILTRVVGVGTSNKTIEQYISELKQANVDLVVDIRASPRSQYFPQFNRAEFEKSLKQSGINYLWMGDKLGNKKDAHGERSMEGFQDYQQSQEYQQGLGQLLQKVKQTKGNTALTCSEGAGHDCHRRYVLKDTRKQLIRDYCINLFK